MKRPRILIADDHRLVAEGLRGLLEDDFELAGMVTDGAALIGEAARLHPDVIITDISMPGMSGLEALAHLRRQPSAPPVILLTMHVEPAYARRAMEAGAAGYVLKHSAAAELRTAIRSVLEGRTFVPSSLALYPQPAGDGNPSPAEGAEALTPRQRQILRHLAEGFSAKQIAAALDISPRTVEFHKYQMMETLRIGSSAELVHFAIKHGIVGI